MKKKTEHKLEGVDCPTCGGTHWGQRFDNCPFSEEEGAKMKLAYFSGIALERKAAGRDGK